MIKTTDPRGIKAFISTPDSTLFAGYRRGDEWSRTLRRYCPWCGDAFYTYQRYGAEEPPGQVDREPDGHGYRSTCGAPECACLEYNHQQRRRVYADTADKGEHYDIESLRMPTLPHHPLPERVKEEQP